ncbi:MAG: CotH kinase family protein [Verrucomicrobia bacterium]|nr:CotH kinase family protein [Verrucomicrobiota bacterium]
MIITRPLFGLAATAVAAFCVLVPPASAKDGQVRLRLESTNAFIQVRGAEDEDWHIQASHNLTTWTHLASLGTLLSGGTNALSRSLATLSEPHCFYRALKTSGLYDPALLRTISLTFSQANWQTLLTNGRTTGSNVLGNLTLDNGAAVSGVGARYRGNTSFTMGGAKKSLNIEMDFTNAQSRLMGYKTINLNNAAGDETVMREPLYFSIMQQYTVCPKGALAKLYINGEYWGVYSLAQNGDGDLIKEWFPSNAGDRWRAPNVGGGTGRGGAGGGGVRAVGGGGGGGFGGSDSALSYLGANVAAYQANYELKTGDGVFGGVIAAYPAGTKVRFYLEARSGNAAKAASFSPAKAEVKTFSFRVMAFPAATTPVVINELMAANSSTLADPQGDYDDWVELFNVTYQDLDLTGCYLSDDPTIPRKWPFPSGTMIPARGYLLVWLDEDGNAESGLHANFKSSSGGEQVLLVDKDENGNALLDSVTFGTQPADRSYGRTPGDSSAFVVMPPTPGSLNTAP